MREYESIFVLDPAVDDAQVDVELEKLNEIIGGRDGEIFEVQKWGRRKLAYEIRKKREGIYTLVRFRGDGEILGEVDRRYRMNESLLRHLTVQYEPMPVSEEGEGEEGGYHGEGAAPAAPGAPAPAPAPAAVAAAEPATPVEATPAPEAAPAEATAETPTEAPEGPATATEPAPETDADAPAKE